MIPSTHICRYWRASIISTPENWALISSRNENLAVLSLQRAKAAPLNIHLDMTQTRKIPGFSDLLASHIHNTETLHVCFYPAIQKLTRIFPNFPQSMPILKSLSLVGKTKDLKQSIDPFGPLTTLTSLSLISVPFYPSLHRLRTLTDLTLRVYLFKHHLDTLLDFLEANRSLERTVLEIGFSEPSLRSSRRRVAIRNHLQSLTICSPFAVDADAFISSIALQKGAHLELSLLYRDAGLSDVLPIFSLDHLPNLQSPTLMKYRPDNGVVRLLGPNGSFSFETMSCFMDPFVELPLLHLTNVRVFHIRREPDLFPIGSITFPSPSLPVLETLIVECEDTIPHLFSTLLSNPSSSPSLKTLAFLDCDLDEDFMEQLTQFASNRKNTTLAWLYRVVIVNSKGILPRFASIEALGKYVSVVDVRIGNKLPADLV